MNRVLLTYYKDRLLFGLWENGRPVELAFYEKDPGLKIDDICLARVKDIVPGIRAAFVQLSPSQNAYLPLEQAPEGIRCGDELAVQITKEAQKTKDPVITTRLSLTGRLAVLVTDNTRISVSARIQDSRWKAEIIEKLQAFLDSLDIHSINSDAVCSLRRPCGFIIRTGAYQASWEELSREISALIEQYRQICQAAATRSCFSRLLVSEPAWLTRLYHLQGKYLQDNSALTSAEILTDSPKLYEQCREFLTRRRMSDFFSLRLYEDTDYPLDKLYRLDTVVEEATKKNVWLKSGGYLVIELTEAMVVIDVNTGKSEGRRSKEENILRLNLEAADEIARQLRLRNLSGMILIDFIDMKEAGHQAQVMSYLREAVKADPVGVTVVDMTKLGIVECTRRKTERPLHEQLRNCEKERHQ